MIFQKPLLNSIEVLALSAVTKVLRWSLVLYIPLPINGGVRVAHDLLAEHVQAVS